MFIRFILPYLVELIYSNLHPLNMVKTSTLLLLLSFLFLKINACFSQTIIDSKFNPIIETPDALITAVALQPNGKMLVGGKFQLVNKVKLQNLARLNNDGTLDPSFIIGNGPDGDVDVLALQADGKILVAGKFNKFNNTTLKNLVRLNSNGAIDESFHLTTDLNYFSFLKLIIQPDQKIIILGSFYDRQNFKYTSLIRLNTDGSLDRSYHFDHTTIAAIALQPDGKLLVGGSFPNTNTAFLTRINFDGTPDNTFIPNTGAIKEYITNITMQGNKIVLVGRSTNIDQTILGSDVTNIVRLNSNGTLDNNFINGNIGSKAGLVNVIKILPNNKILLGGSFNSYNNNETKPVAQLNPDGSLDVDFNYDISGTIVSDFTILPDDKILIAGSKLTSKEIPSAKSLLRLLPNGTLDLTFGLDVQFGSNGIVKNIVITSDSKILISGSFSGVNGNKVNALARLFLNGNLDLSFNTAHLKYKSIVHLQQQTDGKVLVGIDGYYPNQSAEKVLVRLNSDGSIDPTFNLEISQLTSIKKLLLQPDGKILAIAISMDPVSYQVAKQIIVRFNANGTLDNTFNSNTGVLPSTEPSKNSFLYTLVLQPDGKIVLAGEFDAYNGVPYKSIVRLLPDGNLDKTFKTPDITTASIYSITVQPDAKILVGGNFTFSNIPQFNGVARFQTNGHLDESFSRFIAGTPFAIIAEPTGKIVVGGALNQSANASAKNLFRLTANGDIDANFEVGSGTNNVVETIVRNDKDGTLYVGGQFSEVDGIFHYGLARLLPPLPFVPTDLKAIYISPDQVNITWANNANNALYYVVQRSSPSHPEFSSLDTLAANVTSYIDKNLVSGSTYYYRVQSLNTRGSSPFTHAVNVTIDKLSQVITFGPLATKDLNDAPFNLIATSTSELPIKFTISSGPAIINGNTLTPTGIGVVRVKASQAGNANFLAAPDVIQEFTVHPAHLSSLVVNNITANGLQLTWDGPSPEFRVLRKTNASSTSPLDGELVYEGTAKTFTYVTDLTPHTAYFFTIYGKAAGQDSYSSKNLKVATSTLAAPTDKIGTTAYLAGETGSKGVPQASAVVTVTQAAPTDGYIQVTTGANPSTIAALPTGISRVIATQYWQVKAVGIIESSLKYSLTLDLSNSAELNNLDNVVILQRANDQEPWTNLITANNEVQKMVEGNKLTLTNLSTFPEIAFGVKSVTGLNDPVNHNFTLHQNYPNPFDKSTTIQYSLHKHGEVLLEVINAQGKLVQKLVEQNQKAGEYQVRLNGAQLRSNSIYFIRLQANGSKAVITTIYR